MKIFVLECRDRGVQSLSSISLSGLQLAGLSPRVGPG